MLMSSAQLSAKQNDFEIALEKDKLKDSGTIEMVAGLPKPPFIIEENTSGIQLEIIREALSTENIEVNFSHLPLGRNITGYQQWHIDGVSILLSDFQYPGLFVSRPYITYENVAITLEDKNITLENFKQLSGKSVIAFQNARKFLGEEYGNTVSYLIDYRELADQQQQIAMLFAGRTDVIILDINIFRYFMKNHTDDSYNKLFTVHHLFEKRHYAAGFKSEALKSAFDRGVQLIKDNGTYQYVLDKYLMNY